MGRDEEATIAFQRALELDPSAAHVYNNLGYLYYKKGDLNHAVEMYQRAIQRGADTSSAYSNLANAYLSLEATRRGGGGVAPGAGDRSGEPEGGDRTRAAGHRSAAEVRPLTA